MAASTERPPPGRTESHPSRIFRTQLVHRSSHFPGQLFVGGFVRPPTSADHHVRPPSCHVELRQNLPPPNLTQAPFHEIPRHDLPPVLRHDQPKPGMRSGGRRKEDVHARCPLPLPPLQKCADLGTEPNTRLPRESLPCRGSLRTYFPPMVTTSWARPRLRLRASVLRPPFVAFRARNPCLFSRFRLRGLYVGPIGCSPGHRGHSFRIELEKIANGPQASQRPLLSAVQNPQTTRRCMALFDFSTLFF